MNLRASSNTTTRQYYNHLSSMVLSLLTYVTISVSVLVTEVPDSTYKGDESDAQSLRDSILRPPTDDLSSYDNNRSDQG